MTNEADTNPPRKFSTYSGIAALLTFMACNGLVVITAILAVFGIAFSINPHVQAVLISLFAVLTSVFVFKGYRQHQKLGPLVLAGVGALAIVLTMYVSYNKILESAALLALVVAAGWDWRVSHQRT